MNTLRFYYFSGTGNAEKVVRWIAAEAKLQNIDCTISDISTLESRRALKPNEQETIVFSSPTHGFNFPPVMLHFIFRFPRGKGQKVIIINTRAGMKLHKLFLPGISGIAQLLAAIIMLLKGYKIQAMYPVDLPSNWISLHPGLRQKVIASITRRREVQVRAFAREKVIPGKRKLKALRDIVQDILLLPIAIVYYLFGRFFLAKTFYASKSCNRCMACVKQCPIQAIKVVDKRPFWSYHCESCMRCMNLCPQRAIETCHGFAFAIFYLLNTLLLGWVYSYFQVGDLYAKFISEALVGTVTFIVNWTLLLFLYVFSYRIMHYLLRFVWFERVIKYTSLTYWKFWRRYNNR
jgi:Pyruvate/2-oxoacid:ferredoxin oxidoreductase delta subunit